MPFAGLALAVTAQSSLAQSPAAPTKEAQSDATVASSPAAAERRDQRHKRADDATNVRDNRKEDPDAGGEVRDHRKKSGDGESGTDTSQVRFRTELEKAIEKAINGGAGYVKLDGHEFVIKAIRQSRVGNDRTISGTISHKLSMRRDDQISYKIRQSGGKTISADMDINRGGFSKLNPIRTLPDEPVTEWLHPKGGKFLDGSWEGTCRHIIASIAVRK